MMIHVFNGLVGMLYVLEDEGNGECRHLEHGALCGPGLGGHNPQVPVLFELLLQDRITLAGG